MYSLVLSRVTGLGQELQESSFSSMETTTVPHIWWFYVFIVQQTIILLVL